MTSPRHPGFAPGSIVPQTLRLKLLAPPLPPDGPRLKAGVTGEVWRRRASNGKGRRHREYFDRIGVAGERQQLAFARTDQRAG